MPSPFSKKTNLEHTSLLKLKNDLDSNRVNDFLINKTISFTLFDNLLTFRGTKKLFNQKETLKVISTKNCNVALANFLKKKDNWAWKKLFDGNASSKKVLEIELSLDCLYHLLSWFPGFQQYFYQKILMSYVIK